MSDNKPMPGPYHVRQNRTMRNGDFIIAAENGIDLAIVSNGCVQGNANARLFAASFDLLVALQAEDASVTHYQTCEECDFDGLCPMGQALELSAISLRRTALARVEER